jgi:hypothetical protein
MLLGECCIPDAAHTCRLQLGKQRVASGVASVDQRQASVVKRRLAP